MYKRVDTESETVNETETETGIERDRGLKSGEQTETSGERDKKKETWEVTLPGRKVISWKGGRMGGGKEEDEEEEEKGELFTRSEVMSV